MSIKSAYREHIKMTYPTKVDPLEKSGFPSARYFQIHFEYMETQMNEIRSNVEAMHKQMTELYSHVALLTAELNQKGDK